VLTPVDTGLEEEMNDPALLVLVRFKSRLSFDAIMKVVEERAPDFLALSGLKQKYYFQNESTGEIGGLYLWESLAAFAAYRESELRASIAQAYEVEGEPRVEVFQVIKTLRNDLA
jgi:hypothetical protein